MKETKTIAVCGKGGVGKTSITALIVKALSKYKDKKILAIDADPAIGLATALGVEVKKTVNDIRNNLIVSIEQKETTDKVDTLHKLDYEMFNALGQNKNIGFLAIGRPEDEGCYCQLNSFLKGIIEDMANNFDYVVIDGEAGIEQINRRVMKTVNYLIVVSDTSAKGINVANTIKHVAHDNKAVNYKSIGGILNRVDDERKITTLKTKLNIELLGWIPEDNLVHDFDFYSKSFIEFPDASMTYRVIEEILARIEN